MYIYIHISIYVNIYICVYIYIIHTANLVVVPRNDVISLSFRCFFWFVQNTPPFLNRSQRIVGDHLVQSFRERLPWDGLASIRMNNVQ